MWSYSRSCYLIPDICLCGRTRRLKFSWTPCSRRHFQDSFLATTMRTITVPLDFTSWCFWKWRWRRNSIVCCFVLLAGNITFLPILGSSTVWRAEPVLNLLLWPESSKTNNDEGGRRLAWSCFPDTQGNSTYTLRKVAIPQCQEDQAQILTSEGISWSYNAFQD